MPAEVHIGTVAEVTDDPHRQGLFVNLKVRPAADLEAVRHVYIVVPVGALSDQAGGGD